eukprot:CAMPEP_0115205344 /NCGR_PEP_ID=MMETSP0270-20121206/19639_1 /TAXON_ID=71861 /ORGANISM="Scrippsiella trochoidea, Strain CCMP3099" /LENGTH=733 /DNA_ID=CAMNT_0002618877 /DNA_START=62 /DNA_END=2263 /DNA_ORIENTATION=+
MKPSLPLVALLAACSAVGAAGAVVGVTPVQKVVALLEKLSAQLEQEGKDEAAAYDKYACFCKEQVDNKLYAIERSTKKIEMLSAKSEKLGGEISSLDTKIGELSTEITHLEDNMTEYKRVRDLEHEAFLTNISDVDGAIDACARALEALKESKSAMGGKTEMEAASLAQIKDVATMALGVASRTAFSEQQVAQLKSLFTVGQPGKAYQHKYHSNEVIALLEDLLSTFKEKKLQLEQDEFDINALFEKRQLGLANEKKFAEKEKIEKEALAESKREEKAATDADKLQETKDKTADQNFMGVLKDDCEAKAALWDQRSQSRSQELTAISEAMTALKSGVAPNWKANKKLVGLQASARVSNTVPKGHWVYVTDAAETSQAATPAHAASFLQVRGGSLRGSVHSGVLASKADVVRKAHDLLQNSARLLGSPILSAAALKVSVSGDHFVKVRQIIKDLVERLEADARAERTQKDWCDEEMKSAVEMRDEQQSKVEEFTAKISAKEAERAQLEQEIAELSKEIAALKKALMEATELRQAESAENAKTVTEAGAGKEAVEYALQVLKAYYQGASLLQRSSYDPWVATNSSRAGNTVGDLAPEVFDTEYKGAQDSSKGIIGLLEVILSDFDRTGTTVDAAEVTAVGEFDTFKDENEGDTSSKEGLVETKEGEIEDIEDELVDLEGDLDNAKRLHEESIEELEGLHKQCVAGVETYEERTANRQKEIEALKEAHDILENWQS